jgi:hypothetical protein
MQDFFGLWEEVCPSQKMSIKSTIFFCLENSNDKKQTNKKHNSPLKKKSNTYTHTQLFPDKYSNPTSRDVHFSLLQLYASGC